MTAIHVAFTVLPKIYAYIDTDLKKRYSLLEPFNITLKEPVPFPFDFEDVCVSGTSLCIRQFESTPKDDRCDGNTLVPEEILGIKTVIGALAHDRLYAYLERMARTFGWSVWKTRKWADEIYGNILRELARREQSVLTRKVGIAWSHISYAGVRIFGSIAHVAYKIGAIILIGVSLSACSVAGGCMDTVIEPDFVVPAYKQEQTKVTTHEEISADMAKYTNTIYKVIDKLK